MAKNLSDAPRRLVAEETIQMHGGIAMTWEYPASHYAKRLVMIDHQLGDADYHLEQVMAAHLGRLDPAGAAGRVAESGEMLFHHFAARAVGMHL